MLIITIGAPGCGKTTAVDRWRAEDPAGRVRLSRDGLRTAIGVGGDHDTNPGAVEDLITVGQHAAVAAWLELGVDVAVDDTCQSQATLDSWLALAADAGGDVVVWDYRGVSVDVCVVRDAARGAAGGRLVGEAAVRRVAQRCAAVQVPACVEHLVSHR